MTPLTTIMTSLTTINDETCMCERLSLAESRTQHVHTCMKGYHWLRVVRRVHFSFVYHQLWLSMMLCAIHLYTCLVDQEYTARKERALFLEKTFVKETSGTLVV